MELENSPHTQSQGAGIDAGKRLMATAIAQQTGKTVEEVLAFMGMEGTTPPAAAQHVPTAQDKAAAGELPKELTGAMLPTPPVAAASSGDVAKAKVVAPAQTNSDEVITEEVDFAEASEEDIENAVDEEDANVDWYNTIRIGGKVRCVYHKDAGVKGKIQFQGKTGKVVAKVSDKGVTIVTVEFPAGKIPFTRLNKKTKKLEKGYRVKKLQLVAEEESFEAVQ